jgi:hypothetical protein
MSFLRDTCPVNLYPDSCSLMAQEFSLNSVDEYPIRERHTLANCSQFLCPCALRDTKSMNISSHSASVTYIVDLHHGETRMRNRFQQFRFGNAE